MLQWKRKSNQRYQVYGGLVLNSMMKLVNLMFCLSQHSIVRNASRLDYLRRDNPVDLCKCNDEMSKKKKAKCCCFEKL